MIFKKKGYYKKKKKKEKKKDKIFKKINKSGWNSKVNMKYR